MWGALRGEVQACRGSFILLTQKFGHRLNHSDSFFSEIFRVLTRDLLLVSASPAARRAPMQDGSLQTTFIFCVAKRQVLWVFLGVRIPAAGPVHRHSLADMAASR